MALPGDDGRAGRRSVCERLVQGGLITLSFLPTADCRLQTRVAVGSQQSAAANLSGYFSREPRRIGCNQLRSMVSFLTLSRDPVAQWIRALPCGGRGRAFESPQGRQVVGGRSRHLALGRPSAESAVWGGDGAVERARLENELGLKAHVGSNPTLPAKRSRRKTAS